ncbi:MAG: TldD/PmbA family protein [Defluviitaleaceae bacterium]|nr:TldD/PmbA family protein [Defluviitaleaceae bacterium]
MEYADFKEALFIKAGDYGFTDCELYYSESGSFSVRVFGGEISEYKNTDSVGASFRGTFGGRVGYSYTEKLDESVIDGLVSNAAGNAGIIEEEELEKLYHGDETYPEANNYNEALNGYGAAMKIETALAMEKYALDQDSRIASVEYCGIGTNEELTRISNTYGLDLHERSNIAFAYVLARAEEDGVAKIGYEVWHGNDLAAFDYKKIASKAVERALSYLKAESAKSGEYPIVFENICAAELFAFFSSVFFAENAQKGFSLLKDKTGSVIASENVTIRDDGICKKSFGSVPFDSEGVATQNKAVVENGILKTMLYNLKSAEKDGVKSTGNGFKPSFRASVGTNCTNFYLAPSDVSLDEMLSGLDGGIFVTELAGYSGANAISGDFSLSADGFMIEGGKKGKPVEQITVAGNFFDMLKNIKAIADDLRFGEPEKTGTFGMPSFYAEGLRVSGL